MTTITLFHGSPHEEVTPAFGLGNDKHDYGRGFYLTESVRLAKEWAVCRPDESNGWVHRYELVIEDLRTRLPTAQRPSLASQADEASQSAADSKRYRMVCS